MRKPRRGRRVGRGTALRIHRRIDAAPEVVTTTHTSHRPPRFRRGGGGLAAALGVLHLQQNLASVTDSIMPVLSILDANDLFEHLVWSMYVEPMDSNYVIARWCIHNKLHRDFYWNAAQCIEKAMKASILLNTMESVSSLGHDLLAANRIVKTYSGHVLPNTLARSARSPRPAHQRWFEWRDINLEDFIEQIARLGNANNRYGAYSFGVESFDVIRFDATFFNLRRLARGFSENGIGSREFGGASGLSSLLLSDATFQPWGPICSNLNSTEQTTPELRSALYRGNEYFFRSDEDANDYVAGATFKNSLLYNIYRNIIDDDQRSEIATQASKMLLDKGAISRSDRQAFTTALKRIESL